MATVRETLGMTVQEYFDMLAETTTAFRCLACIETAANVRFTVRDGLGVTGCCDGCGADKFMLPVRVDKVA